RVSEFPDRPSRLTCGFAWIGDPLWDSDDPTEHVYEVVYEGDDAFATHMGFVADPSAIPFAEVIRRARAYWRGEGIRNELLVPGPLRVVAIIR
ncbi:MAG: hypothetical protein ABI725_02930, partial [Chloroflexota bacterium]